MNIWFDGKNLHIDNDDDKPTPAQIIIYGNPFEVNHDIQTDCNPCDRCHSRQEGHGKILPFREETLCDDCKQKLKLLAYITEEK